VHIVPIFRKPTDRHSRKRFLKGVLSTFVAVRAQPVAPKPDPHRGRREAANTPARFCEFFFTYGAPCFTSTKRMHRPSDRTNKTDGRDYPTTKQLDKRARQRNSVHDKRRARVANTAKVILAEHRSYLA
jgi:hypothetical protein